MLSNRILDIIDEAHHEGDVLAKNALEKIDAYKVDLPKSNLQPIACSNDGMSSIKEINLSTYKANQKAKRAATVVAALPFVLTLCSTLSSH